MDYTEVKAVLLNLGLKEIAATNWANSLTQDDRQPSLADIHAFVEKTLPGARKRLTNQKARRPVELLTTPEEKFHD